MIIMEAGRIRPNFLSHNKWRSHEHCLFYEQQRKKWKQLNIKIKTLHEKFFLIYSRFQFFTILGENDWDYASKNNFFDHKTILPAAVRRWVSDAQMFKLP